MVDSPISNRVGKVLFVILDFFARCDHVTILQGMGGLANEIKGLVQIALRCVGVFLSVTVDT